MTARELRERLDSYLALRRALGFAMRPDERLLRSFIGEASEAVVRRAPPIRSGDTSIPGDRTHPGAGRERGVIVLGRKRVTLYEARFFLQRASAAFRASAAR